MVMGASVGCIELCAALGCDLFDNDNGSSSGNGNGPPPSNDNSDTGLRVNLSISNTNPSVGEEVVLLCRVISGDAGSSPRFEFQPARDRLVVDEEQGVARFIVDSSDVGVQFSATCTVTTEEETSSRSNRVSFIASGTEP